MGLKIDQVWIETHRDELLKLLETDFDPHLKRIVSDSITLKNVSFNEAEEPILELITEVLEFGSCSGVKNTYPQIRHIKINLGDTPLSERLINLL